MTVAPEVAPATAVAEPEPFDEVLREVAPRLQRYAERRLFDRHEAEEVVQEALLRAFTHRAQLASADDVRAWLTVVTGRLVIDRLRVRGRSTPVAEVDEGARRARDVADVVVARDEARLALDALEAMPTRQAAVLWAREVEGCSYDDIARQFGLTEPSVRSLLHRARRTLRREYALRGGSLPGVALVALAPWLHGLRAGARLRAAARRVGAGALTATGLSIVVATGIGAHPQIDAPSHPADVPAVRIAPVTVHHPHHAAHAPGRHAPARRAVHRATPAYSPHRAAVRADAPQRPLPAPHLCDGENGLGCDKPRTPTVYVQLPVPVLGTKWVGVATDHTKCAAVPATPVTKCVEKESSQ